jgi:hypothetical protein
MKSWWLGASLALAATLAACSGNIGGGSSTLPGSGASPISQVAQPTATPTPLQANSIVTYGDPSIAGPQPLPTIAGYGGTITLPTPGPSPKGQQPVAIGITAGIVQPTDAPVFDPAAEARRHSFLLGLKKADQSVPVPLFFISIVATSDVTLHELPKLAIDVPRDIVLKYRKGTFGLALFDPSKKSKHYDLAVAEMDQGASAAVTRSVLASPTPSGPPLAAPSPSASPLPSPSFAPSPLPSLRPGQTPPPNTTPVPKATPTLPPARIAFTSTAMELQLVANRPVVFALYAIPVPKPSPSPSAKPTAAAHGSPGASPSPAASGSPSVATSPAPAMSGSPAAMLESPAPAPSPASSGRP